MSLRRLPPGDNPFRPLRCRDVALLMLAVILAAVFGLAGVVALVLS